MDAVSHSVTEVSTGDDLDVLRRAQGMIAPARARLSRIVHDMIGDGAAIMQPA